MQTHTSPRIYTSFDDRRRHVRHKLNLSPVVVVDLGPNNGGNLIDISGGGLSLQAVAKLNPAAPLTLHFRLQGMTHPIEVAGRVMWVGPTEKVAGISFKNLPGSTQQLIADWVARQKLPAQDAPPEIPSPEPEEAPLPLFPISLYQPVPRARIVLPLDASLASLKAGSKSLTEPINLAPQVAPFSAKRLVLPNSVWNSPTAEVNSSGDRIFVAPEKSASESRWRRRGLAIALIGGTIGIVALILIVSNFGNQGQAGTASSQNIAWGDRVRTFFGMEIHKKMDPAKAGVQVWTVQRNGYYYCADDPNFKKLLPGAIMAQADAIQSGYQPRLDFCK